VEVVNREHVTIIFIQYKEYFLRSHYGCQLRTLFYQFKLFILIVF
jgi:hypothetical protein